MKPISAVAFAVALAVPLCAGAGTPDEAKGLWISADKGAVIEFKSCGEAICGRIVWDKDAGTPADTCGIQVAQLERYDNGAWRQGWVYDPRDKKNYKGIVRVKDGDLFIRAFVGVEVLGETEQLKRVESLPATPSCRL